MKIVFFDGHCGLCNSSVDLLMRIDRREVLKFASLQGETARAVLGPTPEDATFDTMIYRREEKNFQRSTAVLELLSDLGGVWKLARIFLFVPRIIRDAVYNLIAKNRFRLFPRRETCRVPTAAEKNRLLP